MSRLYKPKPKARFFNLNGITVSLGNRKIVQGVGIFNLPAISTCPGKTPTCKAKCYARKAERRYSKVCPSRAKNLESSSTAEFTGIMVELISMLGVRYFRIHESGDFYSQEYLDKWIEIAEALPEIRFLAFTASHSLDFSGTPENMSVLFSVWPDTPVLPTGRKVFVEIGRGFHCPHDCGPGECTFCWKQSGDVVFQLH